MQKKFIKHEIKHRHLKGRNSESFENFYVHITTRYRKTYTLKFKKSWGNNIKVLNFKVRSDITRPKRLKQQIIERPQNC